MSHIIIGTAGHIDHGKSALIRALTGTDPDRLKEEKQRGLTIDLGFAFLGDDIAFIDVPGHEKFVKNMVAGVSTIDMAMLVVAADDGVMPQTREHLDILSLLQIPSGILVITKTDLVEPDFTDLVEEELRDLCIESFMSDAPVFRVSAITGEGIEELKTHLLTHLSKNERPNRGFFWMPVDRSFSVKGFGTVVTGSVLSGQTAVGDALELLPDGKQVRVRNIQTHGHQATTVGMAERGAINIHPIDRENVHRGQVLATPGYFSASSRMDARLSLLPGSPRTLRNRSRIRLHLGTDEIMARVRLLERPELSPGSGQYVQLLLERPTVAMRRQPFVIRQYSPTLTIGGGVILDANAKRFRKGDTSRLVQLKALEKQDPLELIATVLLSDEQLEWTPTALARKTGMPEQDLVPLLDTASEQGEILAMGAGKKTRWVHRTAFERLKVLTSGVLTVFHEQDPLKPGISKAELKNRVADDLSASLFDRALQDLEQKGVIENIQQWIRLSGYRIRLDPQDQKLADRIETEHLENLFQPPDVSELSKTLGANPAAIRKVINAMIGQNTLIATVEDFSFHKEALQKAGKRLIETGKSEISVSEFRELVNTSRKYALPLLTLLDDLGMTERVADIRLIHPDSLQKMIDSGIQ
ncbi:selenocysteine-specific translation elongation factor [candidate division KSB1 bacterium]|nr:selenocysteine-specific translation elongation factor [candidate division KSB1 bacterium]